MSKLAGMTKKQIAKLALIKVLRIRLSEAQNHRCPYCGVTMVLNDANDPAAVTIDHIVCVVDGGTSGEENLIAACKKCNHDRGRMNALQYYANRHPEYVRNRIDDAIFGDTIDHFIETRHLYAPSPDRALYYGFLSAKFLAQNGACSACTQRIPFLRGQIMASLFGDGPDMDMKVAVCRPCHLGKRTQHDAAKQKSN